MSTKPEKAYILRHKSSQSHELAKAAADSCEAVGLSWQYWDGYCNMSKHEIWVDLGLYDLSAKDAPAGSREAKAAACTASHHAIWYDIVKNNVKCAVILEHDAIMLHKPNIDIPDHMCVGLGYRIDDLTKYDHKKAGAPQKVVEVKRIAGTHAYAINNKTAHFLINKIKERNKPCGCIDAHMFNADMSTRVLKAKIGMCDPISAVAWLRGSTIQNKPSTTNINAINSYKLNLK
jgi:GR25 family glycosyltransferase involved in LPS biosynthesis